MRDSPLLRINIPFDISEHGTRRTLFVALLLLSTVASRSKESSPTDSARVLLPKFLSQVDSHCGLMASVPLSSMKVMKFKPFRLVKFRTMTVGADQAGLLTAPSDRRVTRWGGC